MTNHLRPIIGVALAAAVLLAGAAIGSERIAKETGKPCTACHDKPGSKWLTDMGKFYETQHSFDGYEALEKSFTRCTTCHVRKPGSTKLTKKGQQFASLAKDMASLQRLMAEGHPAPAAK